MWKTTAETVISHIVHCTLLSSVFQFLSLVNFAPQQCCPILLSSEGDNSHCTRNFSLQSSNSCPMECPTYWGWNMRLPQNTKKLNLKDQPELITAVGLGFRKSYKLYQQSIPVLKSAFICKAQHRCFHNLLLPSQPPVQCSHRCPFGGTRMSRNMTEQDSKNRMWAIRHVK